MQGFVNDDFGNVDFKAMIQDLGNLTGKELETANSDLIDLIKEAAEVDLTKAEGIYNNTIKESKAEVKEAARRCIGKLNQRIEKRHQTHTMMYAPVLPPQGGNYTTVGLPQPPIPNPYNYFQPSTENGCPQNNTHAEDNKQTQAPHFSN